MKKFYETFRTTRVAMSAAYRDFALAANAGVGHATVTTDKADYMPGEIVTLEKLLI